MSFRNQSVTKCVAPNPTSYDKLWSPVDSYDSPQATTIRRTSFSSEALEQLTYLGRQTESTSGFSDILAHPLRIKPFLAGKHVRYRGIHRA